MNIKQVSAAAAAMALAVAPVALNAESFDRAPAPVAGESEMGGDSTAIIVTLLALAGVIAGVVIVTSEDEELPVSA